MYGVVLTTVDPWVPKMSAKTQAGGIVPGSRGAMTPGDPGMTAGGSARPRGFGPG